MFDLIGVPVSGLGNFVYIPMFHLCFKFVNACSVLTLDKPNSAWKFLSLKRLPRGL